jgi:hypothetical protein
MSTCLSCHKEIPETERRLHFSGTLDWTAAARAATADERALSGTAEFCSIRCLGTFIGVTLQSRGLIPAKNQ